MLLGNVLGFLNSGPNHFPEMQEVRQEVFLENRELSERYHFAQRDQERLPRRRTRIRKSLELARGAASRVWRGGLRWSKHTLSFRWVCSWTSVPAMSPKPRDEDGY